VILVNLVIITNSLAYYLCVFLNSLTPCFFALAAPFVLSVTKLKYNNEDGESKRSSKVYVKERHKDKGKACYKNNRCNNFYASLRLIVFTFLIRSFSNKS
jgi:hypothetical protein